MNTEPTIRPNHDESDLLGRARSGDGEAFGEMVREYADRLLRQAVALSGDAATAEDLVQETFIRAWRGLARYHGGCQFFTWLCSILIHRHLHSLRWRWPRPLSLLLGHERAASEEFLERLPDDRPCPDHGMERAERAARVLASLAKLPAKQREVVYLRFYAQDSLEGIAAALGCSVGTVKSRLHHGLERLRRMKTLSEE